MRKKIRIFEREFSRHHDELWQLVAETSDPVLFRKPVENPAFLSFGELALRSAGRVEQTFGGLTSRLWDDPFEWTLPEELSGGEKILEYFKEVEATRDRGFRFLRSDDDLLREIPSPEKIRTIFEILLETIIEARKYEQRARLTRDLMIKN
ncbi:MAG: hypothetical protein R2681_14470 [Pyrinomonadaceae bacterium]